MEAPDCNIPPPPRPMISAKLRALKRGQSWLFEGTSPGSVQAIVARLKREFDGTRQFTSQWQGTGLRVWRTK